MPIGEPPHSSIRTGHPLPHPTPGRGSPLLQLLSEGAVENEHLVHHSIIRQPVGDRQIMCRTSFSTEGSTFECLWEAHQPWSGRSAFRAGQASNHKTK